MRLHQLKVEFDAEQDRLLMRVSTSSGEEALLWLTRRCVLKLWPLLLEFVESKPEIAARPDPLARKAMFEFEHEKALSQATFNKAYEEVERSRPLGNDPLLVVRLQRRTGEDGKMVLGLFPAQGQGIFLTLDGPLLHGLMKLLQRGVAKAEWGFGLMLPVAEPPTSESGSPILN
ncbi:MAG: hypothetical protein C5B46_05800 [Proteobacteria bacterium]|nr:MAG: hypothetical protein C5B46_05800 [Pseudomonadota bacterium]